MLVRHFNSRNGSGLPGPLLLYAQTPAPAVHVWARLGSAADRTVRYAQSKHIQLQAKPRAGFSMLNQRPLTAHVPLHV